MRPRMTIAGWRALAIALVAVCFATGALALTFPTLTGRVVDNANILNTSIQTDLTRKLADLESKTTTQLVVVTLSSLQDTSIEDYGYQLGREWKIGQQGVNNGALLIVAPNERKVRIEVGYGLEGTLTDAISKLIIENSILPRFRAGDIPGGIVRGTDDLVQVLSGGAEEFKQRAKPAVRQPGWLVGMLTWIFTSEFGFIIAIFIIVGGVNGLHSLFIWLGWAQPKPKTGFWHWWNTTSGSSGSYSGGSYSSGSSWSSGSSGGGFSGGGGSFGGGGSSGSW